MRKAAPIAAITALCVAAAIAYGIVHDLVTAHLCVEYFSVAHPHVIESRSPVALALVWGVLATWWVGLLLGVPLGLVAQLGSRPPISANRLAKPVLKLLAVMAGCALLAGLGGRILAQRGLIQMPPWYAENIPKEHHTAFLAVGAAHLASYTVGFLGGVVLMVGTVLGRRRQVHAG